MLKIHHLPQFLWYISDLFEILQNATEVELLNIIFEIKIITGIFKVKKTKQIYTYENGFCRWILDVSGHWLLKNENILKKIIFIQLLMFPLSNFQPNE